MPLGHNSGNDAGAVGLLPCPFCGAVVEQVYVKRDLIWIEHPVDVDCPIADGLWVSEGQWNTRAATNPAEPSEWQPIETLPTALMTNGSAILYHRIGWIRSRVASWSSGGWWTLNERLVPPVDRGTDYWRPLPEPPLAMTKGGGNVG